MESHLSESIVIRFITDKPVRKTPYQVKGVFMKQFSDEKVVPFLNGKLRNKYLYPRVQVKILNEQIYIVGIKEGINPIISLIDNFSSYNFGNITINIEKYDIEKNKDQFTITEKLLRYKFITPWIALNKSTGGKYRFLADQEKPLFLNQLLGKNLLFIAKELGFDPNSPKRAACALVYMLEQEAQNGHTCFPRKTLLDKTIEVMHKSTNGPIKIQILENSLEKLIEERFIKNIINDEQSDSRSDMLAIPKFYYAEQRIVENFQRLAESEAFTKFDAERDLIVSQENRLGIKLDEVQLEAIQAALQNKVLIITGGPGTGKTTLVRFILGLMSRRIPSVSLAAPTGRAAKRLTETTAHQASTIHRLLEADNMGFQRDRDQPLESELLIIDESSMVDTLLMDALLDAIPSSARLVLVGDVDQLPSVGPGMVLRDLIDSETINVVRLERIFRQSEESLITSNAHHVRLGHLPELPKGENSGNLKDFYFIRESDPEQIVGKIIQMVSKNIPDRFGFNPFQDIQVLTPMHAGVTGTINLNRRLQSVLNPDGAGFEYREQWFKIGDKLMQQQNDYEKQVFNGDMGRIVACDPKSREVHVEFDQGTVRYSAKEIDQLALAYAISVHKSQGSEYPALILPLTTQHYMMLQRNLLYTALTRGKQLVILIGMEKAVAMAVKNEDARTRHTSLPRHFREIKQLMAL